MIIVHNGYDIVFVLLKLLTFLKNNQVLYYYNKRTIVIIICDNCNNCVVNASTITFTGSFSEEVRVETELSLVTGNV